VKPQGNFQKGHFRKAADLKKRFKRDISNSQKSELVSMFAVDNRARFLKAPKRGGIEGRVPVLAGKVSGGTKLRAEYKGKTYKALVLKDGSVRFKRKRYTSPSTPAVKIAKRAMNGWKFWDYERAPGDWVKLDEKRK
jgi:hypothetical protein